MITITGDFKNIYHNTAAVNPPPYDKYRKADYAIITMSGKTQIEIMFDIEVESVIIRPLSANIEYMHKGNKIEIIIDRPLNFSVEINNSIENAVLIFADFEKKYEFEKFDNVIVFEDGVHEADMLEIKNDNTAIWLKDGAYVHGCISAENINNLAIFGKGLITLENYARKLTKQDEIMYIKNCKNVKISDVLLLDSCTWNCKISGCDNVEIDNLKIIGGRGNSDGIDICGSRNVYVHNCFTRVWDDSLVVKGFDTGDVYNILFENCTLWCDMAHPIDVGVELRAEHVKNITFRNIDVIHSMCGYPVLGIHHGDRAKVSDIVFEDIRIEDAPGAQLFDVRITDSVWNTDDKKGTISDIVFKDISYIGKNGCEKLLSNSRIEGFSDEAFIDGVTIENITVCGKSAFYDLKSGLDIYDYVKNVKLVPTETGEKAGIIKTQIEFEKGESGIDVNVKFYNSDEKAHKISAKLKISPSLKHYTDEIPIELDIASKEEKIFKTNIKLPAGKFVLGIDSKDASLLQCYKYLKNELILSEELSEEYFFSDSPENDGVKFSIRGDLLIIKSELLKKNWLNLYTALPSDIKNGEVLFTVRDTDMGNAPAVIMKDGEEIMAPQLRNHDEITYVFKNEPEVKNFKCTKIGMVKNGVVCVSLDKIGVGSDAMSFVLELELIKDNNLRYACSLFNSEKPAASTHMYVNVMRRN